MRLRFFLQVVTSLSYIMCAALGYLSFSATADGNILKTYPASTSNDVLVLSMAASIILSYPGDPSPQYSTLTYNPLQFKPPIPSLYFNCFHDATPFTLNCSHRISVPPVSGPLVFPPKGSVTQEKLRLLHECSHVSWTNRSSRTLALCCKTSQLSLLPTVLPPRCLYSAPCSEYLVL
jgi:hypothetical protein